MTGGQITDQVLAAQGIPAFTTQRTLDPVRAAALAAAVELCHGCLYEQEAPLYASPVIDDVLHITKRFEQYLASKETP